MTYSLLISSFLKSRHEGACDNVSSLGTKCLSIEGELTLYLNETFSSEHVIDATETIALMEGAINAIMDNDTITSAHPDLVELTFLNGPKFQELLLDRKTHTLNVVTSLDKIGDTIYTYGWYAAMVLYVVAAVFATIYMRRKGDLKQQNKKNTKKGKQEK